MSIFQDVASLMVEAVNSSEPPLNTYQTTWQNIPILASLGSEYNDDCLLGCCAL
jgi:hypothetical protein